MTLLKTHGTWRYSSYHSFPQQLTEVNGQPHAPPNLMLTKKPSVAIKKGSCVVGFGADAVFCLKKWYNLMILAEIKYQFLRRPFYSLATGQTVLSRIP